MKFKPVFLLIIIILFSFSSFAQTTYFIKYKSSVPLSVVNDKISEQKISNAFANRQINLPDFQMNYLAKGLGRGDVVLGRIVKVEFSQDVDAVNFKSLLSNDPEIEYIQEANTYQIDFEPNDSLISEQWALEKIKAFDAWEITQGADTVLLAIIDTGIDYEHPDLKNKIYINPGENGLDEFGKDKRTNGIDDDGNGFIDDYMGWDFTDRLGFPFDSTGGDYLEWDNDPYDDNGHGTYIAGIAAAEANNFTGIAGAAPLIKALNLRAFDPGGYGEEDDVAAAILYAVQMGAKVINMSFGDYIYSYVLRDVIRYAYSQNVVLVASSGNYPPAPTVTTPHYPSGYSEVISVGNSTQNDYRSSNSVYGSTLDLVAPGSSIMTTAKGNTYAAVSGTSASAPFVSAAASLILSRSNFTNEEVKQIIKSTTDDIGKPGWDEQHGAGRLNMERALRVLAPSHIKINFPTMDYGTFSDTLRINASVLSAYFVNYKLEIGKNYIPEDWTSLIENGLNQFSNQDIYTLNLSNYSEGSYTIRLLVNTNDGRSNEERVTFHIMRSNPKVVEVGVGSLYYGDHSTIAGEYFTNQPCIMKMYYRKFGESNFNYISLDGFTTNNQFVKQFHYGFIPKDLVLPSTNYEVYFEAENLAGLKTVVMDSSNGIKYFNIKTDDVPKLTSYQEMPFSLPNGNLWDEPVSFLSENYNEILLQLYYTTPDAYFGLYRLEDNVFIKVDSLAGKFPRAFGDFNNNGLKDFVSYKNQRTVIDEQTSQNTFSLTEAYNNVLPGNIVKVNDLDNDGTFEIIYQVDNSSYVIKKIKSDLTVDTSSIILYKVYSDTLDSDRIYSYNNYVFNNIEVTDANNDGVKEVWFVDADGDLISYNINSLDNITKGDSLRLVGLSTTSLKSYAFSAGDYDGNGIEDFAILFNTNSIAPTFYLMIVTFQNHIPQILFEKVFLDQSEEYSGGISFNNIYQSLKFVDIDNDNRSELILNLFPYSYIFKNNNGANDMIFFKEGSNSARVFSGDLNQNGVPEIGLLLNEKLKFFEFSNSNRTSIPSLFKGCSMDSTVVKLSWVSDAPIYYLFKGTSRENLDSIGFTTEHFYLDNNIELNQKYYYAVKAYDPSKPEPLSGFSSIIEVYAHTPAIPVDAVSNSSRSVIVTFSEKMKNTIDNLQSFYVIGFGYPNSISANNQFSYLMTFNSDFNEGEHKIIVKDIKDYYGSPIQTDTLTFNTTSKPEESSFYVSNFEIINSYKIKLTFNLPVDQNSALNKNNYIFSPDNKVSSVIVDQTDPRIIYLDLTGNKPIGSVGREYVLRIEDLFSDVSSGGVKINSGAGSYLVLSTFAKDLSGVFVYPNPTKENSEKITFANLPQWAKITIWSIDGKMIFELEENDGNGGVDFDLKDFSGNRLSSGVYIYRVVQLDNMGNDGEEKLGKFAIIR